LRQGSDTRWTIRDAHPEDRDASLALAYRAFDGDPFSVEGAKLWDWLFVDHPSGRAAFVVADAGEQLAGPTPTRWTCRPRAHVRSDSD
jgi:hypothetical protein